MPSILSTLSLRTVLLADAATCLAMGALLTGAGDAVAALAGLPPALVSWAGLLLFPSAALMVAATLLPALLPILARLVVLGNGIWVLASIGVLGATAPTALGTAFVLVQAAAVAVIAATEWRLLPGPSAALA